MDHIWVGGRAVHLCPPSKTFPSSRISDDLTCNVFSESVPVEANISLRGVVPVPEVESEGVVVNFDLNLSLQPEHQLSVPCYEPWSLVGVVDYVSI